MSGIGSKIAASCAALVLAAGCATRYGAPVVERAPEPKSAAVKPAPPPRSADAVPAAPPEHYVVRRGDTLYSIALDHGLDYRELAQWNGISDPGAIRAGQRLRLSPPAAAATPAPLRSASPIETRPLGASRPGAGAENVKKEPRAVRAPYSEQAYAQLAGTKPQGERLARVDPPPPGREEADEQVVWSWPARGKVISTFNEASSFRGISIAGKAGQPVLASAAGRVIFSGTGIRGLGKLIVIKHNHAYLSVYAHNRELLVKEGETVARGQKIAEMGSTDTDQVKLHFEIRRFGKPVDPLKLLPPEPAV